MTRIDITPVEELHDKHLLSNYRELPRVYALALRYYEQGQKTRLPETYRMGTGHVKFFYDKGAWLKRRFEQEIVPEMQRRGFVTNFTTYREHPTPLHKDWTPNQQDMAVDRARIAERLETFI